MDDGRQIDMEMQVAYFEYWDERILFYLSKIFTDQLKKGDPYENLKQCIHVGILDFTRFEDDEQYFRTITFCDTKTGKEYTDLMKILILELPKLPESLKTGNNLVKWMRFLNGKSRRDSLRPFPFCVDDRLFNGGDNCHVHSDDTQSRQIPQRQVL